MLRKYFAYFSGLKNFLTGRNREHEDSSSETEDDVQLRRAAAIRNLALVHEDLQHYRERVPANIDLDEDIIRSKLLLEYGAFRKVPVLSERKASNLLLENTLPELPKRLAGKNMESLCPPEIFIEYWYWASVADGRTVLETHMDPKIRCDVRLPEHYSTKLMRPSWAMPLRLIAEEIRFFLPLMDILKQEGGDCCAFLPANSEENCMMQHDRLNFEMIEQCFPSDYQFVVINYRVFDSVVPSRVIKLCFEVLMQKIDFSQEIQDNGSLQEVDAASNERRFMMMVRYFLNIPIQVSSVKDEQYLVSKVRGIPGGSCFTHLIRTMSNFVITWVTSNMVWQRIPCKHRFYGKKCVLVFDSKEQLDLKAFSESVKTNFGVVVDPNRTCITANVEDFHSLGYCCNTDDEGD